MAKMRPDKDLYERLRDSGLRKKVAKRVSDSLPAKGAKKPAAAQRVADELSSAVDAIRDRAGGGKRKRSEAAKKAAKTRKANAAKRSQAAKKSASKRTGSKSKSKS